MTVEQFVLLQTILINATWPFIVLWTTFFVAIGILLSIFIFYLMVTRELLARFQI